MTLYSRRQLLVVLLLLSAAGGGLLVGAWRRAHPSAVERLEALDRAAPDESIPAPRPRIASLAKPPPPARPLDLNRAHAAELTALPGVGASLAARIVEQRERYGPFASVDELRRVRGFGVSRVERLRTMLTVAQ